MKTYLLTLIVSTCASLSFGSPSRIVKEDIPEQQRSMPSSFRSINESLNPSDARRRFITQSDLSDKRASIQTSEPPHIFRLNQPARTVTDGVPTVYGLLESSKNSTESTGLYVVGIDGSSQLLWARPNTDKSDLNLEAETLRTGFYRNGDLYIFERSENGVYGHEAYSSEMYVYDLATGELKSKSDLSIADAKLQMFLSMAYDPKEDMVYAYTISYDIDTPYYLVKFRPDTPSEVTTIATKNLMSVVLALTYHDGSLYGIQYQGYTFVKINPSDGTQTAISKPFATSPRFSWNGFGMTWVDSLDGFVFNHIYNNGTTTLDLLTLDGNLEKLVDLPQSEQYSFLFTAGEVSNSEHTPSKPVIESNTFEGTPSLEGSFTLTMPTTYANGTQIPAGTAIELKATAGAIEGTPDKKSYLPGETALVQFSIPADGRYSFEFRTSIADGFSSSAKLIYVGYDIPSRPSGISLKPGCLSWEAVKTGINDGYFVPADVSYDITIDGVAVAKGIAATEYAIDFTEGELSRHKASVVATHHGHNSETANSNDLVDGRPLALDVVLTPTPEQAELFTVIDSNSDGQTWEYGQEEDLSDSYFKYRLNSYRSADDWLITPPVAIPDASNLYSFKIEANRVNMYPERFEVRMGTDPDPGTWTTVLIPETEVPSNAVGKDYQPYTADFNVAAAGTYYFGVHCTSAADMHTLRVRSIKVIDTARSTEGPDVATGIEVTPAHDGALQADVTITLPELTISGERINPLETLVATVSTSVGEKSAEGRPGERVTAVGVPATAGFNDFTIVVSQGHLIGKSYSVQKYVGPDVPGRPENLKYEIDETNYNVTLTWEPPTKGAHGGYVDPSALTYTLCYLVQDDGQYYWQVLERLGSATSISVTYEESEPFIDNLGVVASNSEGMGLEVAQAHFAVGRLWTLPMREAFENSYSQYYPFMIMGDTEEYLNSNWGFVDPSKAGDQYSNSSGMALVGEGYEDGARGMFGFPKFTTSGLENVSIAFDIYLGSITPDVDVYAEGPAGTAREKIGTLTGDCSAEAWRRIEMKLPEKYCNIGWVQIILDAHFKTDEQKVLIDAYSFKPAIDYDLGVVSITGPNTPEISRENHYSAIIDNIGTQADNMPAGIWRVISGGREIASSIVPAMHTRLEPDAMGEYRFSFTPSADNIGPAIVSFEIGLTDDNNSNNSLAKEISIAQGSTVAVTDLVATNADSGICLSWSQPKMDDGVESFEKSEPFLINDDAAWIGNFRNIDMDGQITYSTSGWTNPNAGAAAAFSVWDLDQIDKMLAAAGFSEHTYTAADGRRLAIAFSTGAGYSTDDWLISPMVVGGSEVTFKIRAISTAYPETIEVLYSATGDSPADFEGKRLLRHTTKDDYAQGDAIEYETIRVTLPEDARYFAIRYVSRDMFALMVDDIHYSPALTAEGITAYDVVRDSQTIATGIEAPDCKYIDKDITGGRTYAYQVIPVFGKLGHGALSNTAMIGVTGVESINETSSGKVVATGHSILATGFEGRSISVSAADGKTIAVCRCAGRSERFAVTPGVYIVSVGNRSYKLIVK